jgi:hypothetical protein
MSSEIVCFTSTITRKHPKPCKGSSKFRPRGPDAFIPTKEGDEFAGIEHSRDIQVAIHEWLVLYGEVMLIAIFVVFFWPLLLGLLVLYFLWKKLSQAVTAFN